MSLKQYDIVDLFAGTGAFSHAFSEYGSNIVYANDFTKESKEIFDLNHNIKLSLNDINNINPEDIPEHDVITAGFPCQPFSISGLRKGFDDERANVFWKLLEIFKYHDTQIVILENVKNLCSHDKGNTFKIIKEELEKLGFYLCYKILDTCKITSLPQHRERIYIVGFKNRDLYKKFDLDFPEIITDNIIDYLEDDIDDKYYYTDKYKVFDLINEQVVKPIEENVIYQYRRTFVRENKSSVCPTLTANMGGGGHNVPLLLDNRGIRKLTPRECFNLQGFPNDYILPNLCDGKLYKLAGNAVSVPIVKLIVDKIVKLNHLNDR